MHLNIFVDNVLRWGKLKTYDKNTTKATTKKYQQSCLQNIHLM